MTLLTPAWARIVALFVRAFGHTPGPPDDDEPDYADGCTRISSRVPADVPGTEKEGGGA